MTGVQISGRVGDKGGIPTFLLLDVIAKLWTEKGNKSIRVHKENQWQLPTS
jgi:hypothetical protein